MNKSKELIGAELPVTDIKIGKYVTGKLMSHISNGINDYRNTLLGKILTIVDASIQDVEQRKAVKDLIKNAVFSGEYLNFTGVRYSMASLSAFLRKFSKEDGSSERDEYKKYVQIQDFEQYSRSKMDFSDLGLG